MNFVGIDVSKQKLDCSLIRSHLPNKRLHKEVKNSPVGIAALSAWTDNKTDGGITELHAILEATGPYHEIAAETLFNAGCNVSVINPAYTKGFAKSLGIKTKTDRVDAGILARYGLSMQSELVFWQNICRASMRYRHCLIPQQIFCQKPYSSMPIIEYS